MLIIIILDFRNMLHIILDIAFTVQSTEMMFIKAHFQIPEKCMQFKIMKLIK